MISNIRPDNFNPKFEVVSCFIEYDGKILMLKRQSFKPQPNTYGVPAGKVEKGESLEKAIEREVKEETGIDISNKDYKFFKTKYVTYDEYQFIYHCFHCKLDYLPHVKINDDEHQLYAWIKPIKAMKLDLIQDEDNCLTDFYNLKLR